MSSAIACVAANFTTFPIPIALTNTERTRNVLEYVNEHDAKVVYASTSEVYDDPEVHPQPEKYNRNVNIRGDTRIFNTYVPHMCPDEGRVIPTILIQALGQEGLTVYGDGLQTRSFRFVYDFAEGLRGMIDSRGLKGKVVNLRRENKVDTKSLAQKILDLVESDSELIKEPPPKTTRNDDWTSPEYNDCWIGNRKFRYVPDYNEHSPIIRIITNESRTAGG